MKKRIIRVLAIMALFSLAIAAYAYTRNDVTVAASACCCKKDADSCPMKSKGHDSEKSEHAKASCCEKHGEGHSKSEGKHECCKGGDDSCPMKKDGAAASDGKDCCDNCDCCKGKSDTAA